MTPIFFRIYVANIAPPLGPRLQSSERVHLPFDYANVGIIDNSISGHVLSEVGGVGVIVDRLKRLVLDRDQVSLVNLTVPVHSANEHAHF